MHLAHPILLAALLVTATGCIVVANVTFHQILDEVNAKRPPDQRFSLFFANVRAFEVLGQHTAFFPESQRRNLMYVWTGIGFVLLLLALFSDYL